MKYMMLIHQGDAPRPQRDGETDEQAVAAWDAMSPDEQQAVGGAYWQLNETPGVTPGLELAPPATASVVWVADGETLITDGPFAEIKEAIGGYFIFEADDLDAALELAARVPAARLGGAVEVRPIFER